jgi:hypothetical protein
MNPPIGQVDEEHLFDVGRFLQVAGFVHAGKEAGYGRHGPFSICFITDLEAPNAPLAWNEGAHLAEGTVNDPDTFRDWHDAITVWTG